MASRKNDERARIRAALYVPSHGFEAAVERTLNNLPRWKSASLKNRALAASSVAAALLLLLVFTGPQIVRAAAQLYQRLFGKVVSDIKAEQAQPEDEKLKAMIADYEKWSREHEVEGASVQIGEVTVSVASVRTMPEGQTNTDAKGFLDVTLTYSKIPSFDPSRVDFLVVVDGREIPQRVDGSFKSYRDEGGQTRTEEEWKDGWSGSNSGLQGGVPTTWLTFDIDDWRWDQTRNLELKAEIDGQQLSIPFTFDPVKAHEKAVELAKVSVALMEENYQHEKGALESMEANAVPVRLTGSAYGYDWAISEMSYAEENLYFTAAFGGVKGKNSKKVGMDFWLDSVTVDGMTTGLVSSDNDELKEGNYTAVCQCALMRDPRKLPEESLIKLTLQLGDPKKTQDAAFRYNWKEKKATLPKDASEMQAWINEARTLNGKLYARFAKDVGYDLTPLNLTREKDGVTMTITSANYSAVVNNLEFSVRIEGDTKASPYNWLRMPEVTINGFRCRVVGGGIDGDFPTAFCFEPPLNISEFGNGDEVVFELPLYDENTKNADYESTNYPEAVDTLRYEFTIDKAELKPLAAEY